MANIFDTILSALSPNEAEAKVTPLDTSSQDTIKVMQDQSSPDIDSFRKQLYGAILSKAQAEPNNVNVKESGDFPPQTIGSYDRNELIKLSNVLSKQSPGSPTRQDNLAHELLHFFLGKLSDSPTDKNYVQDSGEVVRKTGLQHSLIEHILGASQGSLEPSYYKQLRPLTSNAPSSSGIPLAMQQSILKKLFDGTPLQQGVIQENR